MKNLRHYIYIICGGIAIIIIGIVLLCWNESQNAKANSATREANAVVVEINSKQVDKNQEGKLVSTTGKISVVETISDTTFNIKIISPKLLRVVEMYQYQEVKDESGAYTYKGIWSEELLDSTRYKDQTRQNPAKKLYINKTYLASVVRIGNYVLNTAQKNSLVASKEITTLSATAAEKLGFTIVDNKYYTNAEDYTNPAIGNVRISFYYSDIEEGSVLAKQHSNTFAPYITESGKQINQVHEEILTTKQMIDQIDKKDDATRWILRAIGLLATIIGFIILFTPFGKLKVVIPFIKVSIDDNVIVLGLALGGAVSTIAISFSWLSYQPLIGIGLILLAIGLLFVVYVLLKEKKKEIVKLRPLLTDAEKSLELLNDEDELLEENRYDDDIEILDVDFNVPKEPVKEVEIVEIPEEPKVEEEKKTIEPIILGSEEKK